MCHPVKVEDVTVGEIAGIDESVDGKFDAAAEDAELLDAGDDRVENLVALIFEQHQQFDFRELPFRSRRAAFRVRAVRAEFDCLDFSQADFLFPLLDDGIDQAVDRQVGVAADRAGEVAVILDGQSEVAFPGSRVFGLFEASQQCVAESLFERFSVGTVEQFLHFETASRVADRQAETLDKFSKRLQLDRVRIAVSSPQENQFAIGEFHSDGDIRSQHELFDDLVAFVVLDLAGSADAAVFVELDFDFGQVKLNRPLVKTPPSKQHGQFVHPQQKLPDFRGDLFLVLVRILDDRHDLLVSKPVGHFDRSVLQFDVERRAFG